MIKTLWRSLKHPSATWALGTLVGVGLILGVLLTAGLETGLALTSTEAFCAESCHEMADNVAREYSGSIHDINSSGVRATCADCHLPKPFLDEMIRHAKASVELYHHVLGTLDTREKFENHRLRLANNVWREMRSNDSRECRNCHNSEKMAFDQQSDKAAQFHQDALEEKKTCIDCHKGIAHELPIELRNIADSEGIAPE